jgi:hypothetical protein
MACLNEKVVGAIFVMLSSSAFADGLLVDSPETMTVANIAPDPMEVVPPIPDPQRYFPALCDGVSTGESRGPVQCAK